MQVVGPVHTRQLLLLSGILCFWRLFFEWLTCSGDLDEVDIEDHEVCSHSKFRQKEETLLSSLQSQQPWTASIDHFITLAECTEDTRSRLRVVTTAYLPGRYITISK